MRNKILVLGATGNIGSVLVKLLKDRNADFAAGAPQKEAGKLERQNIKHTALDFSDPAGLENAMRGSEKIFMLLPLDRNMTGWAENILTAAKKAGIRHIVRSSLLDASPDSPYALYRTHGGIDRMVRNSGITYTIMHPNSFMQNFIVYYREQIVARNSFAFPRGDARVSYVDVRDIAACAAELLLDPSGHEDKEYDITGPQALSHFQIADILSAVTGRDIRYIPVGEREFEREMQKRGVSDWDITMTLSLEKHIRDGKSARISNDIKRITGREPDRFMKFAHDHVESWLKAPLHVV